MILFHHLVQRGGAAEIGRNIIIISHGKPAMEGCFVSKVFFCNPVISDQRYAIHGLICVGWIRKDLLIPNRRRIKYYFRYFLFLTAKPIAIKLTSVFQKKLLIPFFPFCFTSRIIFCSNRSFRTSVGISVAYFPLKTSVTI